MNTINIKKLKKFILIVSLGTIIYFIVLHRKSPIEFKRASTISIYKINDNILILLLIRNVKRNSMISSPYLTEVDRAYYTVVFRNCEFTSYKPLDAERAINGDETLGRFLLSLRYANLCSPSPLSIAMSGNEELYSGFFPINLKLKIKSSNNIIKLWSHGYDKQFIEIQHKNDKYSCVKQLIIGDL